MYTNDLRPFVLMTYMTHRVDTGAFIWRAPSIPGGVHAPPPSPMATLLSRLPACLCECLSVSLRVCVSIVVVFLPLWRDVFLAKSLIGLVSG